jgi:hypothetical protein
MSMQLPSLEAEEFLAQRFFVFRLWFLDKLADLFLLENLTFHHRQSEPAHRRRPHAESSHIERMRSG